MENLFVTGINIWLIIKILALLLLVMYLIFSLVVIKQVNLMTRTLQLGYEQLAKTLSYLHFLFAVLVFLAAVIIL